MVAEEENPQENTNAELSETPEQEPSKPSAESSEEGTPTEAEPESEDNLVKLLEDARAKADEHFDQLTRTKAELENLRKRQARELENAHKFALEKFAGELIDVWDHLEMGAQAAASESGDLKTLLEGTEMTLNQLISAMNKHGVEQVAPLHQPFNPDFHQAIGMQPSDEHAPNTVLAVMRNGYTLNGRLLRPAMVTVSQASASSNSVDEKA